MENNKDIQQAYIPQPIGGCGFMLNYLINKIIKYKTT